MTGTWTARPDGDTTITLSFGEQGRFTWTVAHRGQSREMKGKTTYGNGILTLAQEQGARPLPTTTLWRRIVRLEQAGYVRREIRPGGSGGTLSLVRVLTPIEEWVTTDLRPGTRPAVGPYAGSAAPSGAAGSAFLRSELGPLPSGF